MTTSRRRAFVSIAATMTITLALTACISRSPRSELNARRSLDALPITIRFDNFANERVDVYLIGTKREWVLGRVEAGGIASLRIPEEVLEKGSMHVRLAVIAGEPVTFAAARNPHARLSVAQPASTILSQQWRFAQGDLKSVGP